MVAEIVQRRRITRLCLFTLLLVVLCAAVSWGSARWAMRGKELAENGWRHGWLHEELGLTDEQSREIRSFEETYHERRRKLQAEFEAEKDRLAQLLRNQDADPQRVKRAVDALHEVHGQLQQVSIEHYYDLLEVLPPEKRKKLRQIAADALSEPE